MLLSTRIEIDRQKALDYNRPGAITEFYHATGDWLEDIRAMELAFQLLNRELQFFTSIVNDVLERIDYEEISDIHKTEEK